MTVCVTRLNFRLPSQYCKVSKKLCTRNVRSNKIPWITSKIKNLINTRDTLKRKVIISKSEINWISYKTARNQVNIELRNAKQNYYSTSTASQKRDPKKAWKSLNDLVGKQTKQTVENELNMGENILNDPQEIAESFNEYFSNIGPNLASKIDVSNCAFETSANKAKPEFTAFQPTTVNNIFHLLSGLSSNKATRIDKISCKIIKIAAPAIADSLTYIFNQAITLSTFPDQWKVARVTSLYKSGPRNIPGNYRPISVLPKISKIMEQTLYNQLYNYLTKFGLLSNSQFGFRKSRSTATALLDCIYFILFYTFAIAIRVHVYLQMAGISTQR